MNHTRIPAIPTAMRQRAVVLAGSKRWVFAVVMGLLSSLAGWAQEDGFLVGVWTRDEGFQTVELLFRPSGHYQLETESSDPIFDFSSSERGTFKVEGRTLTLLPHDYLIRPEPRSYTFEAAAEWAAEKPAAACQVSAEFNPELMNTGVSLRTAIAPDTADGEGPIRFTLTGPVAGQFTVSGTSPEAANLVTEFASIITLSTEWKALQTNTVSAGPYSFTLPRLRSHQAYFRLRRQ